MSKSNPWIWSLYDFANSLASIVVSFYFSLFIVSQLGKSDIWVSVPVALATFLLLITLPFLGSVTDKVKRYKPALFTTTMLTIGSLILLGIFVAKTIINPGLFIFVIVFYFLFQYFYQAAMAFYLPFLQSLSQNHSRDFVASLGLAAGQLGNIVGLVIAFPLASSSLNILGLSKTPLVFCFGAILFLIFFLIFNKKFKEEDYHIENQVSFLPKSFKESFTQFAILKKEKNVLWYLIAYYLFADAILTLQLFASLYLDKVGHLSSGLKTIGFVVGLFTAVIGAMLTPWVNKKIGNLKKAISITILVWSILLFLMAIAVTPVQMFIMLILNGFAFGTLFSLSRIMYSKLIPKDEPAKYFGLYVLFERFASILGPLIWSFSTFIFAFAGEETKYRFAIGSLAILVLISYFVLRKVKEDYRS